MNQQSDEQNILGSIFGVSELTFNENPAETAACSVVVAENALVFLAWDFGTNESEKKTKR